MVTIRDPFVVYKDERFFSSFPSAVILPDGDVLITFRRALDSRWLVKDALDEEQRFRFTHVDHWNSRSHIAALLLDGTSLEQKGQAWSLPSDPEGADQDPNLIFCKDGSLIQTGFLWYPASSSLFDTFVEKNVPFVDRRDIDGLVYIFWGGYSRHSFDYGKTWSDHRLMPAIAGYSDAITDKRSVGGGAMRGRPVQMADGTLYQATYLGGVLNDNMDTSFLYRSTDQGKYWTFEGPIAADGEIAPVTFTNRDDEEVTVDRIGFQEPSLVTGPNETLLALHRTTHPDDFLYVSGWSEKTGWSPAKQHAVVGHPYDPLPLSDDRIFLSYGYRHHDAGVRARLVTADMPDFGEADELIINDQAPSFDAGYPWSVQLQDGRILCLYYMCDDAGIRHIAGTVVEDF